MNSIWKTDVQMPHYLPLEGELHTDVLVIGGGLAGLLCAFHLKRAGVDCILIEQDRMMIGVSGLTTAKLTVQHGLIYSRLLKEIGKERAQLYWQANRDAVQRLSALAQEADCDFTQHSSYLYATGGTERLEEEMEAYQRLGISAQWKSSLPLPFSVTGAIAIPEQAQFHPLKLAAYIAKDLPIYENTKALSFYGNRVQTPKGAVMADKIIVATHFPLINKHGAYFLKLYQQRSYVIALENAVQPEGMYLDCAANGLSIRSAGPWLLLGGGGHRTGKKGMGWKLPELAAARFYPHAKAVTRWATQDCMSLDGMPYIGHYSKATPNLYVATGFQKWGMSSSMIAATVLRDLLQEKENPYASLFDPSRSMLHRQLLYNGVEATVNLLRPAKPRCPHMGCVLQWNQEEHSWDCPCHGSRFDDKGKLLNNPATDDMKKPPR